MRDAALTRARPVVLVLEDLHNADSATLDLLGYLLAHPVRARLLVLLTYRALPDALTKAAPRANFTSLVLDPLSPNGMQESPDHGPLAGGTRVSLQAPGVELAPGTTVKVGAKDALNVDVETLSTLAFTTASPISKASADFCPETTLPIHVYRPSRCGARASKSLPRFRRA